MFRNPRNPERKTQSHKPFASDKGVSKLLEKRERELVIMKKGQSFVTNHLFSFKNT